MTTPFMHACFGLRLALPDGQVWEWIGHRLLPSLTRGDRERLEQWQIACTKCARPFIVLSRLGDADHRRFLERRGRGDGDVRLTVDAGLYPQLEIPQCRRCRAQEQRHTEAESVPA